MSRTDMSLPGPSRFMAAFNFCLPQGSLLLPHVSSPGYCWGSLVSLGFCDKDGLNESQAALVSWLRSLGMFWPAWVVSVIRHGRSSTGSNKEKRLRLPRYPWPSVLV